MNTITKSILSATTLATVFAVGLSGMAALPASAAATKQSFKVSTASAKPQLAIGLKTNKVSRSQLASLIRSKAAAKGVTLSPAEVNQAVNTGMGKLASGDNGPLKGIIHIKFKRFTICIDWGKDQGHCG